MQLSREQFCQLSGTDVEALKTLMRRKQMQVPVVPGRGHGDSYTPFAAFLMAIANEFANGQGIARSMAAEHASKGFVIDQRWVEVATTSEELFEGRDVAAETFFAVVELPGLKKPRAVCGTLAEIMAAHPNPVRLALCNVSRIAAAMRMRAARHKIDLGTFWSAK